MLKNLSLLAFILLFVACNADKETKNKDKSFAIKKKTKLVSPSNNQKISFGEDVAIEVIGKKDSLVIDSVALIYEGTSETKQGNKISISTSRTGVGVPRLILNVFFQGKKETFYPKVRVYPGAPEKYTFRVLNAHPHDTESYTQGLLFYKDELYESTGQYGESKLRKVNLSDGEPILDYDLDTKFFGEGISIINDKIYQLTYHAQEAHVYNLKLEKQSTIPYDNAEGWGLTNIGDTLIMSDGSEFLYFRNPDDFSLIRKLSVYNNKRGIKNLNELEYANGLIYANVYQTDLIVVIDPGSGAVVQEIDMKSIFNKATYNRPVDVLNGIAFRESTGSFYVTGKLWPSLYEVAFTKVNENL